MDEKFVELGEETQRIRLEEAVANVAKKALPDANLEPQQFKTEVCLECDIELPLFRKQKGCLLCTGCQTAEDRRQKRQFG